MKRKTLIALAVASLFAAPLAYAASSVDKTWERPVIAMTEDAIPDQQEDKADLIRLPNPALIADSHEEKKEGESSQLIAEDEKKEGESTQLIAEDEKKEGESTQLIAEDEKKEGESTQLIAEDEKKDGESSQLIA